MKHWLKYTISFILFFLAFMAFTHTNFWCWGALLYAWVFIPLVELTLKPDITNFSEQEEQVAKNDHMYDIILYVAVVLHYLLLVQFLRSMQLPHLPVQVIIARIATMGLLCGTFGINVAHELGHRSNRYEQLLAKAALLTSLYTHFFIEHNRGHHKWVATPHDPSTAPLHTSVYRFWLRSVTGTYINAWRIVNKQMKKQGLPFIHYKNEMLQLQLMQVLWLAFLYVTVGGIVTLYYIAAATIGFLLLETVNYIEHYGLLRKLQTGGQFERTMPWHSWNSNHVIGRLMLFELSRHSDHHYLASRKYQILRHQPQSPQMPTGYPGMMLLSLIPPIWFYLVHKKMQALGLMPAKQ